MFKMRWYLVRNFGKKLLRNWLNNWSTRNTQSITESTTANTNI